MDKLLNTLNQYLNSASSIVHQYGPSVWNATLELIRLHAIFELCCWVAFTAAWVVLIMVTSKFSKKNPYFKDLEILYLPAIIGLLISFGVAISTAFPTLLAIWDPRLELIYHLASKAGVL